MFLFDMQIKCLKSKFSWYGVVRDAFIPESRRKGTEGSFTFFHYKENGEAWTWPLFDVCVKIHHMPEHLGYDSWSTSMDSVEGFKPRRWREEHKMNGMWRVHIAQLELVIFRWMCCRGLFILVLIGWKKMVGAFISNVFLWEILTVFKFNNVIFVQVWKELSGVCIGPNVVLWDWRGMH